MRKTLRFLAPAFATLAFCFQSVAVNWGQYPSTNAPGLNDTFLIGVFSGPGGTNMQISAGNLRTWVLSADTTSIQASGSASVGQGLVVTGTDGQGRLTVKGTNWPSGTAGALVAANNLSDVASASTALQNIGGNNAGNLSAGTVAAARLGSGATSANFLRGDSTFQTVLIPGNNLSDVLNVATARANLGADNAGNLNSGTVASARLGTGGVGGGAKFLADDQTFKPITGGGDMLKSDNLSGLANNTTARANIGANDAGNLNAGTLNLARLSADVMRTNATFVPGSFLYTSATDQLLATNVGAGAITNDGNGKFGAVTLRDSTGLNNNSFAYADNTGHIVSGNDGSSLSNLIGGPTVSGDGTITVTPTRITTGAAAGSTNYALHATGGGGGALAYTNYYARTTNAFVFDASINQTASIGLLTNSTLILSNANYLTNVSAQAFQINLHQDTNGFRSVPAILVSGGLLRTNGTFTITTNANATDILIGRIDGTRTNVVLSYLTNCSSYVDTNSLASGGGGGGGGLTLVSHTSKGGNTTTVTTDAIDTTGANLLIAFGGYYNGTPSAFSDSKGNTWTVATNAGAGTLLCQEYYCVPTSVGSGHTFQFDAAFPGLIVLAYSGANATPLDRSTNGFDVGGATTIQNFGAMIPSVNGTLIFAGVCAGLNDFSPTVDSGLTVAEYVQNTAGGAGNHLNFAVATNLQTTATSINPTWTISTGTTTSRSSLTTSYKP
jgi:hypothetical protein